MAKFNHYHIQYNRVDMFSEMEMNQRQEYFGQLFLSGSNLDFSYGEEGSKHHCKHQVYALKMSRGILVLRIANDKQKEVEQDFKKMNVRHEPSCFVVIDNRPNCRRIAIQRVKESFASTEMVRKILTRTTDERMQKDHHIGVDIHPEFVPKDFYVTWKMNEYRTQRIRFNVSEGRMPDNFSSENLDDDTIMGLAIKLSEEDKRTQYRSVVELNAVSSNAVLLVDEDSNYIRNLVAYSAQTGSRIEIVTLDGTTFNCFVDDEDDSASLACSELDASVLEALFEDTDTERDVAEKLVLDFVNSMKYTVDNNEKKEAKLCG